MKFFVVVLAIFALFTSALALKNDVCGLPHSADGNGLLRCMALMPSWSYKADANECVEFNYGGCGGNNNRFESKEACEKMCKE